MALPKRRRKEEEEEEEEEEREKENNSRATRLALKFHPSPSFPFFGNPIAPERVLLFMHLSSKNVSHDSQCFGIDLDLETILTFNQPHFVSSCVDGNIMPQCIPKIKPWKQLKFLIELLKESCMMS